MHTLLWFIQHSYNLLGYCEINVFISEHTRKSRLCDMLWNNPPTIAARWITCVGWYLLNKALVWAQSLEVKASLSLTLSSSSSGTFVLFSCCHNFLFHLQLSYLLPNMNSYFLYVLFNFAPMVFCSMRIQNISTVKRDAFRP